MSRNLRARIDKLERRTTISPHMSILDVLLGRALPEDLDQADREALRHRQAHLPDNRDQHPALIVLREHWARLGLADPGQYGDLDIIEEAIRLVGILTPSAPACGLKELPTHQSAPP
jgi:hypothetical protein